MCGDCTYCDCIYKVEMYACVEIMKSMDLCIEIVHVELVLVEEILRERLS